MQRGLRIFILFLMIGFIGILVRQLRVPAAPQSPIALTPGDSENGYETIEPENAKYIREVRSLTVGETTTLSSPIYSPDGHSLVASASDGRVYVWDVTSGALIKTFEKPDSELINPVFSSDGQMLITATRHEQGLDTFDIWDAHTGMLLYTFNSYDHLALSSTGQITLRPMKDDAPDRLEVWDGVGGRLIKTLEIAPYNQDFFYNADGRFLIVKSDTQFDVFETATWGNLLSLPYQYYYDFNPTQNILAFRGDEGNVEVVDIAQQIYLQTFSLEEGDEHSSISLSPDGQMISIRITTNWGYFSGHLYDVKTGQRLRTYVDDTFFRYTPDNRLIVSLYSESVVRFWDAATHKFVSALDIDIYSQSYISYAPDFLISPNGRTLATRSSHHTLKLWAVVRSARTCTVPSTDPTKRLAPENIDALERLRRFEILGPAGNVEFLITPNNQFLVANTTDFVHAWELDTDAITPLEALSVDLYTDGRLPVKILGFTEDNQSLVLTQGDEQSVRSVRTGAVQSTGGKPVIQTIAPIRRNQSGLSPDKRLSIIQDSDTIILSDAATGVVLKTLDLGAELLSSAFSPDGRYFMVLVNNRAGQSLDNTLYLWGLCDS